MPKGSIDWTHMSEENFNRTVEALLMRMYHKPPESTAEVLNGRGGDGGIDVAVYVHGKIERIFQLKHFPEGFSGGFRDTRRRQIKKSFATAWENHKPPHWNLVIPPNPGISESKFVTQLAKGMDVTATVWGQARLDSELAKFPDLVAWATRDALVDTLATIGQEHAGLVRPEDLTNRAKALHDLADGRSAYWTVDFGVANGVVTQVLRAKDPRAAELEPLGFRFNLNYDEAEMAQRLQRVIDFGARRHVIIPGSAVSSFKAFGPEWFREEGELDRLEFPAPDPLSEDEQVSVTLEFLDEHGFTAARHQGLMVAKSSGARGVAFIAKFHGVFELDAEIPANKDEAGTFGMAMKFPKAPVRDVRRGLELIDQLGHSRELQVLFDGERLMKAATSALSPSVDNDQGSMDSLRMLVDDLCALEARLNATFSVPELISNRNRVMIRVARLLSEGKASWMPPETVLPMMLSGESIERIGTLIAGGGAVTAQVPTFAVEIQGSKFNLGPAVLYHSHVAAINAKELQKAMADGTIAGRETTLIPQDGKLIWVMPGPFEEGKPLPESVAWGLPGIPQPGIEASTPQGGLQ